MTEIQILIRTVLNNGFYTKKVNRIGS